MRPADLLLSEPRPLLVRRALAHSLGLNEAIQLQQLHWLLDHYDSRSVELDGRRWLKAEMKFWREQFPWSSDSTIKRTFDNLVTRGLVERNRGRESSVYAINYDAVDGLAQNELGQGSHSAERTAQNELAPCKGEAEKKKETTAAGTTAAGDQASLLPSSPASDQPKADGAIELRAAAIALHQHYVAVFGDRMRVKELTPPRERVYTKALKAVAGDLELCKRAITGLKSYRDSHPRGSTDVQPSVIFETNMHSTRSLTDQIEWWAEQSKSGTSVDHPDVPSVMRDRINERRLTIIQMVQQPDNSSLRQRGEQAEKWLREHAQEEPVIEGDRVIEWRRIA